MRFVGLDRLRGFAIFLMLLDHLLVVSGHTDSFIRFTVTRAALPLFCFVSAIVPRSGRFNAVRFSEIVFAGLVSSYFGLALGIGQPDVLLLFAVLMVIPDLWFSSVWFLTLSALQPFTWPVPTLFGGYQIGTLVVLFAIGCHFVDRIRFDRFGLRLPLVFERVGRWPVLFYVGHLGFLYLLKVVFNGN